jgi:predicted regulator of Ras-like GTPase activity (Roadblock/LC7/MglB family)
MQVLMEGMKRLDEKDENIEDDEKMEDEQFNQDKEEGNKTSPDETMKNNPNEKGEPDMSKLNEIMEKFKVIEGLMAAGAFTPQGEKVTEVNPSNINLGELGALANDVLLKAQKSTDVMGVGRGQLVHIEAPKAHVLARCLNESTDYSATTAGRAHVHMIVVLDQEGNLGMAKMRLESIIQEIAEHFR